MSKKTAGLYKRCADLHDIILDFKEIQDICAEVCDRWHEENFLTSRLRQELFFSYRNMVFDGLVIRYARAFGSGRRNKISKTQAKEVLSDNYIVHEHEIINRRNKLTAHSDHPANSSQSFCIPNGVTYASMRAVVSQLDFKNLLFLVQEFLPYLDQQKRKAEIALKKSSDELDDISVVQVAVWGMQCDDGDGK